MPPIVVRNNKTNLKRRNKMKRTIITTITAMALLCNTALAVSYYYVNDYYRTDGTHVSGHWKSTPDCYKWNNLGY